jgi:adenylate cyclase class IV
MSVYREVEIKCRVEEVAAFRRRIKRIGALPVTPYWLGPRAGKPAAAPRVHEMNFLFDTPQGGLAKHGQLLRIRVETQDARLSKKQTRREHIVFTYKGPAVEPASVSAPADSSAGPVAAPIPGIPGTEARFISSGRHKVREEIEVEVTRRAPLAAILEALGMRSWFQYEKFRSTYRFPAKVRWALDLLIELDETPIGAFVELEGPPDAIDRAAALLGFARKDYITKSYLALYLDECRVQGRTPGHMLFAKK